MVNTGRPSRGCFLCRSRRVKCDEKKPGCGNCQRLKRECPGYRPIFDVMHRNETKSTERRTASVSVTTITTSRDQLSQKTASGHLRTRSVPNVMYQQTWKPRQNSWTAAQTLVGAIEDGRQSITPPLTASLEERAICFFLANYVLIPHGPIRCGFLGFLIPMMRIAPSKILSDALTAVALATFGNQPNAKMLKPKAEQAYAKALRQTTTAIANPRQALEDSTLAAVLLLGLFETVTHSLVKQGEGWNSWNSHVNGATALLKIRDPKGPMSPLTLELVWTVKAQLNLSCLLNGKVPDIPKEWTRILAAIKMGGGPAICNQLQSKVAKARVACDNLMANAQRTPQDFEDVLTLMRQAEAIEQGYVDWANSVPDAWGFKPVGWIDTVPTDRLHTSPFFPGKIDKYFEVWTAHIWNLSRGSRLINSSTIVRCAAWLCSPQDYRTTVEYEKAMMNGREMIRDIISSVPNCLGEIPRAMDDPAITVAGHTFACGEENAVRAKGLSGLFLLWPLFSVAVSDFATDAQRTWVMGRIKYVSEELGVVQGSSQFSQAQPSARIPSSMLEKDGLKPLEMDNILELQIPSQDDFLEAEKFWSNNNTNTLGQYPTPSPTSTTSSGRSYEWTALSPGSLNLTTINHWSHRTQIGWVDPNAGSGPSPTSMGTMRQILAMSSPKSTHENDIERSPTGNSHGWLKC
ncbi:negative acting factor protein [Rutstroemia sp. NJR-2017a WRK4]|nr:negative acting factor protein [Rutstroemia sp. NJR-2017a WRK4]PQE32335.1 negative acting factor protein [Rutstroemia sp. NJR-2017a WRK4]